MRDLQNQFINEISDKNTEIDNNNSKPNKEPNDGYVQNLTLSKIFANDIRGNVARMFMNTLNSGDCVHVQNFFNTFMTRQCKVLVSHLMRNPALNYPGLVVTDGPRQFSHYLLGAFVQFPDMTVSMQDCRLYTHTNWLGTKVEMDITVYGTKMCEIKREDWVPSLNQLAGKYEATIQKDRFRLPVVEAAVATTAAATTNILATTTAALTATATAAAAITGTSAVLANTASAAIAANNINFNLLPILSTNIPNTDISQLHREIELEAPDLSDLTISSGDELHPSLLPRKRTTKPKMLKTHSKTGKTTKTLSKKKLRQSESLYNNNIMYPSTSLNDILTSTECMGSHIPEEYSRTLLNTSKFMSKPLPLATKGRITLYLNEHNQLQSVDINLQQTN